MNYQFMIQASNPRTVENFDPQDRTLAEAVQTVYPMDTESCILYWNGIGVIINYRYDLGVMLDDAIELCSSVQSRSEGVHRLSWPSSTFDAVWDVRWTEAMVVVNANWRAVAGRVEAMLNASSSIEVSRSDFLAEWKRPMVLVYDALVLAGYSREIRGLVELGKIAKSISKFGALYRE